jgi:hypothetical protein
LAVVGRERLGISEQKQKAKKENSKKKVNRVQ